MWQIILVQLDNKLHMHLETLNNDMLLCNKIDVQY